MHQGHVFLFAVFGKVLRATAQYKRVFPVERKLKVLYAQVVKCMDKPAARACDGIRYASSRQRSGDFKRAALNAALFERRKNL